MNTTMIVNTREARAKRNDDELDALLAAQKAPPAPSEPAPEGFKNPPPEEGNWEKRYSDLRSHSQKQINELQKKISALENQKQKAPMPSTPEEFQAWVNEFPDAVRMFKTLIRSEQGEAVTPVVDSLKNEVETLKYELRKEKAFAKLQRAHNDALQIVNDPNFHGWLEDQRATRGRIGQALFDAIHSDDLDADAAADAISQYKQAKGLGKKEPKPRDTREAALSVTPTRTPTPSLPQGKRTYTEEEIENMNIREYEKLEEDIDLARREGRILTRRNIGAAM